MGDIFIEHTLVDDSEFPPTRSELNEARRTGPREREGRRDDSIALYAELVARIKVPVREWVERAACRGMDPALFFPERGEDTRHAKAVCGTCPVSDECLTFALETAERHGIWGQKSEKERRVMRRQDRGTAA